MQFEKGKDQQKATVTRPCKFSQQSVQKDAVTWREIIMLNVANTLIICFVYFKAFLTGWGRVAHSSTSAHSFADAALPNLVLGFSPGVRFNDAHALHAN